MKTVALCVLGGLWPAAAFAQAAPGGAGTYGQHLVDMALARHPDVVVMAMHVTPPKSPDNIIIASNIGRIGKKADEDDLSVINRGITKLEVNKTSDRFEVEAPLRDVSGDNIGALGIVFPYKVGDDQQKRAKEAELISKEIFRRISNVENLLQPYPFDPKVPSNTVAQKLLDAALDKHPEVQIMAFHVTPPGRKENIILASNIGRIGKVADEDDMDVVKNGKIHLEVNSTGKRFEVEIQLHDSAGKSIGALSTVFAYKAGDDQAALQKKGEQIRDELAKQIPSIAAIAAVDSTH